MGVSFAPMRCNDTTTTVTFPSPHDDAAFVVALSHFRWPNGGVWSFFRCPCGQRSMISPASAPHACAPPAISGRRARILRLYDNALACRGCLKARGFRARVELIATPVRAAHTVPRRLERLVSPRPARLHPRPGRVLDRRSHLEASLRRSQIVARQHALDEHAQSLAGLMRGRDE